MEVNIVGRNLGITDRFRDFVTEKSQKAAHLATRALSLEIKVTRQHESVNGNNTDRVELTLVGPGPLVRAEADGPDKYTAFDSAMARLLERIRRAKDRRKAHRGGRRRQSSLQQAVTGGFDRVDVTPADVDALARGNGATTAVLEREEPKAEDAGQEYCPVVIRKKVFASAPMTVDDALYYMELVGHDFYLFIDRETSRPSVVYRRKGWDYGVIALDDDADEQQEESIAARA